MHEGLKLHFTVRGGVAQGYHAAPSSLRGSCRQCRGSYIKSFRCPRKSWNTQRNLEPRKMSQNLLKNPGIGKQFSQVTVNSTRGEVERGLKLHITVCLHMYAAHSNPWIWTYPQKLLFWSFLCLISSANPINMKMLNSWHCSFSTKETI